MTNDSEKLFMEGRKRKRHKVTISYAVYCTMAAKSLIIVADFTQQKEEKWLHSLKEIEETKSYFSEK